MMICNSKTRIGITVLFMIEDFILNSLRVSDLMVKLLFAMILMDLKRYHKGLMISEMVSTTPLNELFANMMENSREISNQERSNGHQRSADIILVSSMTMNI